MTPFLSFVAYLIVGVSFAVYQWLVLVLEIHALNAAVGDLFPKDKKAEFLAKVFGSDIGSEDLITPAHPKQFVYRLGRWVVFWPYYLGVHIKRTVRAGLKK